MGEKQVRDIVREEICLAMESLASASLDARCEQDDMNGSDAVYYSAGVHFGGEYGLACQAADEQRAEDAVNPFKDTAPEGPDKAVQAYVQAQVTDVLKHLRDTAYLAGTDVDHLLASRLDNVIADRLINDE